MLQRPKPAHNTRAVVKSEQITSMITEKSIFQAMKSVDSETVLSDGSEGRGKGSLKLVVRRGASGAVSATWFATWKRGGRRRKKALGHFPDLSVREARHEFAENIQPQIEAGGEVGEASSESPTVARLFAGYVADMIARERRSVHEVERALTEAQAFFGADKLAADIEPGDVSALLAKVHARGAKVQADRLRAYLSAAFQWGIKAEHDYRSANRQSWGLEVNPVAKVPRDTTATSQGERNLSAAELATFWKGSAGAGFSLEVGSLLRLVVCCGQRVRETLRAKGADFDLKSGTWTLPRSTTKGGKEHVVPLPEQAIPLLRALVEKHGDGPLFPASTSGRAKSSRSAYHVAEASVSRAVAAWCKDAGFPAFTPRDLRRTWKSRTADAGIERFMRDLIQQHAQAGDTGSRFYDRADYLPQMREAMVKWSAWLGEALAS